MYYTTTCPSPVGLLTLASDGEKLIGLWLKGQKYFGAAISEEVRERSNLPLFNKTKLWLDKYFSGKNPSISQLPLGPCGSEFRRMVWGLLCEIPYGEVVAYGEIAQKIAAAMKKPGMSSQAIGGAVGHNPISIVIPCHRVVGANGSLTGYAGGIDKKIRLLTLEGVDMSCLFVPHKSSAP